MNDHDATFGGLQHFKSHPAMEPLVDAGLGTLGLWKRWRPDDSSGPLVADAEDYLSASLVGESDAVLRHAVDMLVTSRRGLELKIGLGGEGDSLPTSVYLTFERGGQDHEPSITLSAVDTADRLRVDAFFVHGQEAATLAVLQSGYATWARYRENLVGQVAFTLESGPEVGSAPQALTPPG